MCKIHIGAEKPRSFRDPGIFVQIKIKLLTFVDTNGNLRNSILILPTCGMLKKMRSFKNFTRKGKLRFEEPLGGL